MPDTTANLSLPYILPSQAQKHVTHNEALQRLDAAVQLVVKATGAAPPGDAAKGDCYWVAPLASGGWTGRSGHVALRQDGGWIFLAPRSGWRAWFSGEGRMKVFIGGEWTDPPLPAQGLLERLGIASTPDATNRLSVASPASLFNNAGNGHQIKVNKAAAGDTASLLFQTGWSGRAEMGLAGDDAFSVKVSGDGGTWRTGLTISADGAVHQPNRPLVRAALNDAVLSPASGTRTGFQQLHVNQGGFTLGAALAGGTGDRLVVPVSGLYLLWLTTLSVSASGQTVTLEANGTTSLAVIKGSTAAPLTQSATAVVQLTAGDWLSLIHTGTAQLDFGLGKTELQAMMV